MSDDNQSGKDASSECNEDGNQVRWISPFRLIDGARIEGARIIHQTFGNS
jgi:hypothetical protein